MLVRRQDGPGGLQPWCLHVAAWPWEAWHVRGGKHYLSYDMSGQENSINRTTCQGRKTLSIVRHVRAGKPLSYLLMRVQLAAIPTRAHARTFLDSLPRDIHIQVSAQSCHMHHVSVAAAPSAQGLGSRKASDTLLHSYPCHTPMSSPHQQTHPGIRRTLTSRHTLHK